MLQTIELLQIDLFLFGEGGGEGGAPAGEGGAQAAEAPAGEVLYGKQPGQAAEVQQETTPQPVDKGKQFQDLIKGEFKDQYTEATQKMINRRFRDTDQKIQSMQPVIDLLDQRYGTNGDMGKLMSAIESDRAYWQDAADEAGMTVEQYMQMKRLEAQNQRYMNAQRDQQARYLASIRYQQWQQEAEQVKQKYPEFDLETAQQNPTFMLLLRNKYPMEEAYRAANVDAIQTQAAVKAEKAVTDNIKARGTRPAEAGAAATPAFTVMDDVSKLSDQDVREILKQIGNGRKVTFG